MTDSTTTISTTTPPTTLKLKAVKEANGRKLVNGTHVVYNVTDGFITHFASRVDALEDAIERGASVVFVPFGTKLADAIKAGLKG